MKDLRECQRNDGAISDVAPAFWRLYNHNITWPAALPMVCDMLYRQYGDISPMEESYESIDKWLRFVKSKSMKDGLMTYDRYGDWCLPPENPNIIHSQDSTRITDGILIANCYYYYLCRLAEEYGTLLGRQDKADYYALEAMNIKDRINNKFLKNGKYSNSTVTANLLPLATGIAPDSLKEAIEAELIGTITGKDNRHIGCGVIGIQWLMRYLADSGNNDIAWEIANNDTYPSWGYMVKNGATTIWELWNGNTAEPSMNSGNHVMLLGDLLPWCYEKLGGIAPDKKYPGFKRIIMKPDFTLAGLDGVKASHKSPYGTIKSEWLKKEGRLHWEVEIPANCEAVMYFPDGECKTIGSGKWEFDGIML